MKRFFLTLVIALTAAASLPATVYHWSRYNLSFETPDNGFITYNSPGYFEVRWDDMVLMVKLFTKDKGDDKKLLTDNLVGKARGYNMYDLNDGKIKVKGFKRTCSLDGTMPDGTRLLMADLVSKKQNLIVEVSVQYLFGSRETAEDIIKSFAENAQLKPNHEKKRQKVQSQQDADKQQQKQEEQRRQQERLAKKRENL